MSSTAVSYSIFITGSTGYIGGSILSRFISHKDKDNFSITALVRNEEKAKVLGKFGVKTILGSYANLDLLQATAAKSDIVIAVADGDNVAAAEAINKGLKQRFAATGKQPTLIHTSGTGVVMDNAAGKFATEEIWDDTNVAQIASLPHNALHRNVELVVEKADADGYAKTYIVSPSTIYGLPVGPFVDAGIQHLHSIQIPYLVKAALSRGQAGVVGEGKNIWNNVHVEDVADLYIAVLDNLLAGKQIGHGREGMYFGENGEYNSYELSRAIGETMVRLGKSKSAEPTTFSTEEEQMFFGGNWLGTNARARANRSRAIGWKPTRTTSDMLNYISFEVEALHSQQ